MANVFSENAQKVLTFLQTHQDNDYTASAVAQEIGLGARQVNGTATGLSRKGLLERVELEGYDKKILKLTDAGLQADPHAQKEE